MNRKNYSKELNRNEIWVNTKESDGNGRFVGGKMNGIELKSGINDCYFNCKGKCVNKNVT
jgi:hypothetical protein